MATLAETLVQDHWRLPDRACRERYEATTPPETCLRPRPANGRDSEVAALTAARWFAGQLPQPARRRRRRAEALHALLPHASPRARPGRGTGIASTGLIALMAVSRHEASRQAVLAWRAARRPALAALRAGCHHGACAGASRPSTCERAPGRGADAGRETGRRATLVPGASTRRRHGPPGDLAAFRAPVGDRARAGGGGRRRVAAAWVRVKLADAARVAGDLEAACAGQRVLGRACGR